MLHISPAYQLEQFEERLSDPEKHWKFSPGDLDERARWADYMRAFELAMERTSTASAPWIVVPAERKFARNLVVASALVRALEDIDPQMPAPTFDPAEWTLDVLHERGRMLAA